MYQTRNLLWPVEKNICVLVFEYLADYRENKNENQGIVSFRKTTSLIYNAKNVEKCSILVVEEAYIKDKLINPTQQTG